MLGRAWCELLEARGVAYQGVDVAELDITDRAAVARGLQEGAATVVNCAAYTDVDGAEANEAKARAVNADGVAHLGERCREIGALLVHYSTDYVFDGQATGPYPVDAPHAPINAYGRTKAEGEQRLLAAGCRFLLVRTSWLYAPWGKNFVRTIAAAAAQRDELRVVADQRGRPSSAQHLAAATLALLERGAKGVFHLTDGGECTWYELAGFVASLVNPACRVLPCSSCEYPRPARRPAYSVLSLDKTEALLGPLGAWQDHVREVVRALG